MNPTQALNRLFACIAEVAATGCTGDGYGYSAGSKLLTDYGYTKLGSGHFSAVIAHPTEPSSKVVKIGMSIEDSWLGFAMYCKENPAPYLPVIEEIILFPKHYVAIMERLDPLNGKQQSEWNDGRHKRGDGANCVARIPESAAMFERLANGRIDMHADNVMWRGEQLVIIDPFAQVKVPGYEHEEFVPKFGRAWLFTELDKRKAQEHEALATTGARITARGEAKDHALWELPKHDHIAEPARMAGVLPQMQRERIRGNWFVEPRRLGDVFEAKLHHKAGIPTLRLQSGFRGRRADFLIVDDLAPDGRDRRGAAAEVFAGMEQKVRQGRVADMDFGWLERRALAHAAAMWGPNFVHALDAAQIREFGRAIAEKAAPVRQEPEVRDGPRKPRAGRLPEFRGKHWERGNKLPRGLRYNRGPALRNPRGGVHPVGSPARDEPREGQARPSDHILGMLEPDDWPLGRPRQGGAEPEPVIGTKSALARPFLYLDPIAERPKEYEGLRYKENTQ